MFNNYKDSLFNDKVILKSQQRFRSDHHEVYTEEVNKIDLNSNDDKWIQTPDKITTYLYGMWKLYATIEKKITRNIYAKKKKKKNGNI